MEVGLVNAHSPKGTHYKVVFLESIRQNLLIVICKTFRYLPKVPRLLSISEKLFLPIVSAEGTGAHTREYKRNMGWMWEWLKCRYPPPKTSPLRS